MFGSLQRDRLCGWSAGRQAAITPRKEFLNLFFNRLMLFASAQRVKDKTD